jgi:hypothetical protein
VRTFDQLGVTAHLGDRFIEWCQSFGRLQCDEIVVPEREHDRLAFDRAGAAVVDYDWEIQEIVCLPYPPLRSREVDSERLSQLGGLRRIRCGQLNPMPPQHPIEIRDLGVKTNRGVLVMVDHRCYRSW